MRYAESGFYILPCKRGTKKPGSLVGEGWPALSSRDPDVIRRWWERWPDAEIAIHCGRSGLLVFDVDRPANLPPMLKDVLLRVKPPKQTTRQGQRARGHYLFRQPNGRLIGNGTGRLGGGWGEVRGANGVIIVAPSTHQAASEGGEYAWRRSGIVPEVPADITGELDDATDPHSAASDAEVQAFLDTYTQSDRPSLLKGVLRRYREDVEEESASRHDSMVTAACWAFRETICGAYPARTAYDALARAFAASFRRSDVAGDGGAAGRRSPDSGEFAGIASWALGQALADRDRLERQQERVDRSASPKPTKQRGAKIIRASEVVEKPLEHLWRYHLYRGKLHELVGDSETGKSLITEADIAARVTTGAPFPGEPETAVRQPENVIITATEDGFNDTSVPRLSAAGADLSRVFLFELEPDTDGSPVALTLPDRAPELRQIVAEVERDYGPIGYLVVSPISAHLSEDINANNGPAVRRALGPLVHLAQTHGIAVMLVRHPNKDRGMKAVDRGAGSGAFTQLVRASFGVGKKPTPDGGWGGDGSGDLATADVGGEFVFSHIANNYAPRGEKRSLLYRIVPSEARPDHPVIEWLGETHLTADDVLSKPDARKRAPLRAAARQAICELLNAGPAKSEDVYTFVEGKVGAKRDTVNAAANELRVERVQVRTDDGKKVDHWLWKWPDAVSMQMVDDR